MTTPAATPMAKAASVQAANVTPRRSKRPGKKGEETPIGSSLDTANARLLTGK